MIKDQLEQGVNIFSFCHLKLYRFQCLISPKSLKGFELRRITVPLTLSLDPCRRERIIVTVKDFFSVVASGC